ncbi:MAG: alpha/beta hydrolase fold domain-containing protein [Thermoanaerobaculia bacterium]
MSPPGAGTGPRPRGADLDPDIRRFVAEMSAGWARYPELAGATPAEARRIAEQVRAPWTRGGPRMARVFEREVPVGDGTVRVRFYDPLGGVRQPALIYLHGGGWTLFSLDTHDRLMREYAARAGVTVVGVDYALAPEAKYPAALLQVSAAVRFLAGAGAAADPELAIDPERLAIGGDSAGANLAIAAALDLRDGGAPRAVRALLLNYGVFARTSSPEAALGLGGPGNMLTAEEMEGFWRNYLRDEGDALDPLACPVLADLRGLPPVLLVAAEEDLLAEQSSALCQRLVAAGVSTRLATYRGASHSFLEAVSIAPLADRALGESAQWLRGALTAKA